MPQRLAILLLACLLSPGLAGACEVRARATFQESAPDYLLIENLSISGWRLASAVWRLAPSRAQVYFDTSFEGVGVSGYHAFQPDVAADLLTAAPEVSDGDQTLSLEFGAFAPGMRFSLLIDVDDIVDDQVRVYGPEIEGAGIGFGFVGPNGEQVRLDGTFDSGGVAYVASGCFS